MALLPHLRAGIRAPALHRGLLCAPAGLQRLQEQHEARLEEQMA